jgi:hypothetical protein
MGAFGAAYASVGQNSPDKSKSGVSALPDPNFVRRSLIYPKSLSAPSINSLQSRDLHVGRLIARIRPIRHSLMGDQLGILNPLSDSETTFLNASFVHGGRV